MKILIVSMRSIHTVRWVSQLKDSGHELYYFDILNGGYIEDWDYVQQHTNWRYKFGNFKGRYLLKKMFPYIHKLLENNVSEEFEKVLNKFKPDVVHSFALFMSCTPIFEVMQKYKYIKWIYSAWGNDLYYLKNYPKYKKDIVRILPYIDYMFADCKRDLKLAVELGFKGEILGDFPGGGGYDLNLIKEPLKGFKDRSYIIVKGYHGKMHRGLQVLKALEELNSSLPIIVFSADEEVYNYAINSDKLSSRLKKIYKNSEPISHIEICQLMNRSLIYIGNNLTDGMPNTLLEAICYGAFPIQSNPGGASAEIIIDGLNGYLIDDCEDVNEIKNKLEKAISNKTLLEKSFKFNLEVRKGIEYSVIKEKVLKKYEYVEKKL